MVEVMARGLESSIKEELDAVEINSGLSRIEPYSAYVMRWKRSGASYETIRGILRDKCGVMVAKSTLVKFILRRRRKPSAPSTPPLVVAQRPGKRRFEFDPEKPLSRGPVKPFD